MNTKKHFILRTGWLYSEHNTNFFTTIKKLANKKDSLNVVYDQIGTPTHTHVLVQTITSIIDSESKSFGVYHVANEAWLLGMILLMKFYNWKKATAS